MLGEPQQVEQSVEHPPVVHPHGESFKAQSDEDVVDDQHGFDVGERALGADRVEVALEELAVPAALRVLPPPHRPHVVALEGNPETSDVFGGEAGEGDREVEAHRHVPASGILEPVHLLVGLGAPLAEEDLGVLEHRRIDRTEPVGAIHLYRGGDHGVTRHRRLGEGVAEALQGAGLDEICHEPGVSARRCAGG